MSESLRNDGRVWVPKRQGDKRAPRRDPRGRARLLPRAEVPELRQPGARATSPRARPRKSATRAAASGPAGAASTSTSPTPSRRLGEDTIRERYGNLFEMYERITDENPYEVPMRIYPAVHYTMGGLWVDYNLMSTIAGPLRHRRGQLLRPRRQPPRRQRPDAGPGRRLLRAAVHHRRLPRDRTSCRPVDGDASRRSRAVDGRCRPHRAGCSAVQRHPHGRLLPPGARQAPVGALRHGAQRRGPAHGARPGSPSCARSSGATSRSSAPARSSTSRSRRRAGWRTSWSSRS